MDALIIVLVVAVIANLLDWITRDWPGARRYLSTIDKRRKFKFDSGDESEVLKKGQSQDKT